MRVSFTWSTRREGNSGFVLEESSAGHRYEFGPMPAHIVPAFVEGRRRITAERAKAAHLNYVEPEDFSWLTDPNMPMPEGLQ